MAKAEQVQSVIITLDTGEKLTYSGRAQVNPGTQARIVSVVFTEPQDLPSDCSFEILPTAGSERGE